MADERKHHIIRIKGKDRSGAELDDVYADVRRIDEITITDRGDGQKVTRVFAWEDGLRPEQPDTPRETTTLKLTNPQSRPTDPDNPDIYIPIEVIDKIAVMDADQRIFYEFLNKVDPDTPTTRKVTVKRITFAETDPEEIPEPIDAEEYERDQDTEDEGQYIDVEVINSYQFNDADQRVTTELDQKDALLDQFEQSPDDEDVEPVRLDPLQQIVNIKWGDIWVLVQVLGGGGFVSATRSAARSAHGDPVGTDISIETSARVLYERHDVIEDDTAFTENKVVVWADDPSGPDTGLIEVVDGYSVSARGTLIDGTLTGVAHGFFDADDTAAVTSFFASHPTPAWTQHGPESVTVHSTYVEAVFLLDNPKEFTVTNSGFPVNIQVLVYPKSLVKVDATNGEWAIGGVENTSQGTPNPGERVWFPLEWKTAVPPYPESPGGRTWPWPPGNYQILPPPNDKDVINLAMFWVIYATDGMTPSYTFKVEKTEHWLSQPASPVDPTLADKIWQVYPTRVDPKDEIYDIENNWYVFGYTCLPLGEAFFGPEAWGFPTPLTSPGPLPKIPPETAG